MLWWQLQLSSHTPCMSIPSAFTVGSNRQAFKSFLVPCNPLIRFLADGGNWGNFVTISHSTRSNGNHTRDRGKWGGGLGLWRGQDQWRVPNLISWVCDTKKLEEHCMSKAIPTTLEGSISLYIFHYRRVRSQKAPFIQTSLTPGAGPNSPGNMK